MLAAGGDDSNENQQRSRREKLIALIMDSVRTKKSANIERMKEMKCKVKSIHFV